MISVRKKSESQGVLLQSMKTRIGARLADSHWRYADASLVEWRQHARLVVAERTLDVGHVEQLLALAIELGQRR